MCVGGEQNWASCTHWGQKSAGSGSGYGSAIDGSSVFNHRISMTPFRVAMYTYIAQDFPNNVSNTRHQCVCVCQPLLQ